MRRRAKFTPYIRRRSPLDKSGDMRVAFRLAYLSVILGKGGYVMVQRGFPNLVIACGENRADLERQLMWLEVNKRYGARFRHYATKLRCLANGEPKPRDWPATRYDSGRYGKSLKGARK